MKLLIPVMVILLLVSTSFIGVSFVVKKSSQFYDGNTLYVGGDGPGNYTKIQDAIENSSDGDTVFVYNGSYYENLYVIKSVNLIGEDKNSTIVNGIGERNVTINVLSDRVNISEFMILSQNGCGIQLYSEYNCISYNILKNHSTGIKGDADYNIMSYNIIENNRVGIEYFDCCNNNIEGNIISNNYIGIDLQISHYNNISSNIIEYCDCGVLIGISSHNVISMNSIQNNELGIFLEVSTKTTIIQNNFVNNEINATFARSNTVELFFKILGIYLNFSPLLKIKVSARNIWDENYWGTSDISKYKINGYRGFFYNDIQGYFNTLNSFLNEPDPSIFNWKVYDWNPAQEPYDIGV